jgi:multidrug efflux pump subunit AcrA (membrane-fusion protein)
MSEQKSVGAILAYDFKRIAPPLVILAVGVAGLLILSREEKAPARPPDEEQPPLVDTRLAEVHDGGLDIRVDGVVVPYREIELAAEVDGRIVEKRDVCRAGSYVQGGTLLLKIDAQDYELEWKRLKNELAQAEISRRELDVEIENTGALVRLAEQQLELEENNYRRQKSLHADGAASDSELDAAAQSRLQAKNGLATLESQLRLLEERLNRVEAEREHAALRMEKADLDRQRTEIRCPDEMEGVIVTDLVEEDDYVRKGTSLVTIEDTSKVEVRCHLRVDELYWLWNQMGLGPGEARERGPQSGYQIPEAPVTVVYRLADRDYAWQGKLSRYEGIGLDESTRTVPCRVLVESPRDGSVLDADGRLVESTGPPALVRGMFVNLKIHAQPKARLLRVPEVAVRPGNRVWVVREGELDLAEVKVVRVADEVAIVEAGQLASGDHVVVTPLASAVEGMAVRERLEDQDR